MRRAAAASRPSAYVRALVEALEAAAGELREMGCTCATYEQINHDHNHGACTGDACARKYEALARRVRRRLATQEKRS